MSTNILRYNNPSTYTIKLSKIKKKNQYSLNTHTTNNKNKTYDFLCTNELHEKRKKK